MTGRAAAALAVAAGLGGLVALGDGSAGTGVRVYAASSLRQVLLRIDDRPRYSFAGSNQLQLQIERGAPADVFAAASPAEPAALFEAGRCTRPRAFATNRLAMLVPRRAGAGVRSVSDLSRPGLRVALGNPHVPVGRAARAALQRLGVGLDRAVVSSETDAGAVVGKVALRAADAGVGYVTDARAAPDRVRAIPFPRAAGPPVEYHVCAVLREGADRAGADAFIDRLAGPASRSELRRAGFGLPG